jgi:hypothetical protein
MLDLRHEKAVACDATFGINDKKILLPVSPQCIVFTRST